MRQPLSSEICDDIEESVDLYNRSIVSLPASQPAGFKTAEGEVTDIHTASTDRHTGAVLIAGSIS